MRTRKPRPVRTTLDLADEAQVRLVRKRLGVTNDDLLRIAAKMGNSIAAISKEIEVKRAAQGVPLSD